MAPVTGRAVAIAGFGEYAMRSFELSGRRRLAARFDPGTDAARLFLALTRGQPIASVTVWTGSRTVALHDARISDFRQSGALVTVEFTGSELEVS